MCRFVDVIDRKSMVEGARQDLYICVIYKANKKVWIVFIANFTLNSPSSGTEINYFFEIKPISK